MKYLKYILVFVVILGFFYFFQADILRLFTQFSNLEEIVQKVPSELAIEKISKDISSPPPLRATKESSESFLTGSGIIIWTNIQRNAQGFLPLSENEQLHTVAVLKAQDMFEKQYFGHVSLSGADVGDLAEIAGYKFLAIGENLALGNFEDNQTVVQGWMDSPGHKANILSLRYTEVGVAATRGIFEGKSTWIVVQEFGLPLSVCLEPQESLRLQIEGSVTQLQELERELIAKQRELKLMRPKFGPKYNRKIDDYNALVVQYNSFSNTTKELLLRYNNQVKKFNACVLDRV
ncbi:hypothetical protein IH779_02395 [Patescibacteria group bacterium]|nr:hypothetical protein [Patescibacteria group bacterium]